MQYCSVNGTPLVEPMLIKPSQMTIPTLNGLQIEVLGEGRGTRETTRG